MTLVGGRGSMEEPDVKRGAWSAWRSKSLAERLYWNAFPTEGGCLEFDGARTKGGYGRIKDKGKNLRAHRVSFELHNGLIQDSLVVLHSCDNPPCIEPTHLSIDTIGENNRDKTRKGRNNGPAGIRNSQCKLTFEQVQCLRARKAEGEKRSVLAAEYGITPEYVNQLSSGIWRKVA